jgi:hypothetical protein
MFTHSCQSQSHFTADSQSVCLGVEPSLWTFDQILLHFQEFRSGICCLVSVGRPLWWEAGSVLCKSKSSKAILNRTVRRVLPSYWCGPVQYINGPPATLLPPVYVVSIMNHLWSYACRRRLWTIGLWVVEVPTFSRQLNNRWRWGTALYSQEDSWYSFLLEAESSPRPTVLLEGLGQLENPVTFYFQACSIVRVSPL